MEVESSSAPSEKVFISQQQHKQLHKKPHFSEPPPRVPHAQTHKTFTHVDFAFQMILGSNCFLVKSGQDVDETFAPEMFQTNKQK